MAEAGFQDKLEIPSRTEQLHVMREFIKRCITTCGVVPDSWHNKILLAVDEAVTNIIEHAYEYDEQGFIEIVITGIDRSIEIVIRDSGKSFDPTNIRDSGKSFDPTNIPEPDIKNSIQTARQGGLGIFLMRRIMDEVEYSFVENKRNELRLVKHFGGN